MLRSEIKTDTLTAALLRLNAALDDMSPAMRDIGELMVLRTTDNFRAGTSPDGVPWAPKSLATIDSYRTAEGRKANSPVPMQPLIGMSRSLSTTIAYAAAPTSVAWGSNMIYAAVMQFGAQAGEFGTRTGQDKNGRAFKVSSPWGDIPARPFLGVGADDETAILDTISDYLNAATQAP